MKLTDDFYRELLESLNDGVYFVDKDRTIHYWNRGATRISGFFNDEVLGTRCCDNILMHVDKDGKSLCEGDCPLVKVMNEGIPAEADVYLHHKNGYRVPIHVRISPMYNDEGEIIGGVEIFNRNSEDNASMDMIEDLRKQIFVDQLTGIPNRRFMETVIIGRFSELLRYNWPFGLMFIDIDHFKSINDTHGHDAGDETLRMVATSLLNCSRSFDTVARWGGEEFVVVVVNVDREQLYRIAERYRAIVEKSRFDTGGSTINVTVSIGATLAKKDETMELLVRRADRLMYASKEAGRNYVTVD